LRSLPAKNCEPALDERAAIPMCVRHRRISNVGRVAVGHDFRLTPPTARSARSGSWHAIPTTLDAKILLAKRAKDALAVIELMVDAYPRQ
jgi:hypothetical protein